MVRYYLGGKSVLCLKKFNIFTAKFCQWNVRKRYKCFSYENVSFSSKNYFVTVILYNEDQYRFVSFCAGKVTICDLFCSKRSQTCFKVPFSVFLPGGISVQATNHLTKKFKVKIEDCRPKKCYFDSVLRR